MRIVGALRALGYTVSPRPVRRYRSRALRRPPSQSWRTFLKNHAADIWAVDLFTVQTLTLRTLYVIAFIAHDRHRIVHVNVTHHPTAAWVWRQLLEATPWGAQPRHLIRDRDRCYAADFVRQALRVGIRTVLTPIRAPECECRRRTRRRDAPTRVPGPHGRTQRAASTTDARRIPGSRQRDASAPDPWTGLTSRTRTPGKAERHGQSNPARGAWRPPQRVRSGCMRFYLPTA